MGIMDVTDMGCVGVSGESRWVMVKMMGIERRLGEFLKMCCGRVGMEWNARRGAFLTAPCVG